MCQNDTKGVNYYLKDLILLQYRVKLFMTIKYQVESSNLSTHTIKYMSTFQGKVFCIRDFDIIYTEFDILVGS